MKLFPNDYQIQFEQYARNSLKLKCLEWSNKLDGIDNLSIRSFIDLHVETPLLTSERYPDGLSMVLGITMDDEPNAFAARNERVHFIGVSNSLAIKMVHFSNQCFCQPFVYQGEYGVGTWLEKISEKFQPPNHFKQFRYLSSDTSEQPEDPERRRLSLYVSCIMFRFVLLHEFAHCLHGHVDYLSENDNLRSSRIYEVDLTERSSTMTKIEVPMLHYLEQEADIFALESCLKIELSGKCDFSIFSNHIPKTQRIELIIFSAYLMLWLLATLRPKNHTSGFKSHPVPSMRFRYLYNWVSSALGSKDSKYVLLNHSAMSQLRSIDTRLKTGWMDEDKLEKYQLNNVGRQNLFNELQKYRYTY